MITNTTCTFNIIRRAAAILMAAALLLPAVSCGIINRSGAETADENKNTQSNVLSENSEAEQSLKDFLCRFVRWYPVSSDGKWEYDCSAAGNNGCNILARIASPASCADWTVYSDIPEEDCFVEKSDDPRGWSEETYAYYMYDAQTVEFIAGEIFNVSEGDISTLAQRGESDRLFYKENGKYYTLFEGTLDSYANIDLLSVRYEGSRYIAVFNAKSVGKKGDDDELTLITGKCRAELELKSIGEKDYWSLYHFSNI